MGQSPSCELPTLSLGPAIFRYVNSSPLSRCDLGFLARRPCALRCVAHTVAVYRLDRTRPQPRETKVRFAIGPKLRGETLMSFGIQSVRIHSHRSTCG